MLNGWETDFELSKVSTYKNYKNSPDVQDNTLIAGANIKGHSGEKDAQNRMRHSIVQLTLKALAKAPFVILDLVFIMPWKSFLFL